MDTYRLVFRGFKADANTERATITRQLAEMLQLPIKAVKELVAREGGILHRRLSEAQALDLRQRLILLGLRVHMVVETGPLEVATDARVHYIRGNALGDLERYEEAILEFNQALQLEPRFAVAHYALALVLQLKGRIREAIREFELYLRYAGSAENARQVLQRIQQLRAAN